MAKPTNPSRGAGGSARPAGGVTTGRKIVTFADHVHGDELAMANAVQALPGVSSVANSRDYARGAMDVAEADAADAQLFPSLGVAVVSGAAAAQLTTGQNSGIVAVEDEYEVVALAAPGGLLEATQFADSAGLTWGLQATGVATSHATGKGVRLAVLDTGYDPSHPDFAGRTVVSSSFVPGQAVQDGAGHGTHTLGTSGGPARPAGGNRRYGCASEAELYVGKVLNDLGRGSDAQVLAGIEWALTNQCRVVSMSLGAPVPTSSAAYDKVGQRALAAGCLIIAAAGNDARRSKGEFAFVSRPANSPYVMAVAAVDSSLAIADFSSRTGEPFGSGVDIAGPGVDVSSSWPVDVAPGGPYLSISGTSMATPHVAGIAAMWSQATGATGLTLWGQLAAAARRLQLPSVDVGVGLVQAPQD